jgi:hypothetical protein
MPSAQKRAPGKGALFYLYLFKLALSHVVFVFLLQQFLGFEQHVDVLIQHIFLTF